MGIASGLSQQLHIRFTDAEYRHQLDLRSVPGHGELAARRVHAIPDVEGMVRSIFVEGILTSSGRSYKVEVRVNLAVALPARRVVWASDLFQTDWADKSLAIRVEKSVPILANRLRRAV